jgi:hypothetical protein
MIELSSMRKRAVAAGRNHGRGAVRWRIMAAVIVFCAGGSVAWAEEASRDQIEFFESRIRPVLVEHCYECHSAEAQTPEGGFRLDDRAAIRRGGDSGSAVVPGKAEESLLLAALQYDGAFYDMPPDGKLPDEVLADFRRWVEMGAPDPREPHHADTPRSASSVAAPDDLWALRPLRRPTVPTLARERCARGPIDQFVVTRLERERIEPAAAANRFALLRRVTYDLTGLPPTLAEIESFVRDPRANAYEKVVARLLASPTFGEHWARHWLDLSCYADLGDVQGNVVLQGAWRYRDYVIEAFNSDKPFDRFIREQIAGDLLPHESAPQRREQLIATGFLAIGPWTLQNYVKPELEADVVDHQIDKIGRTFLGMSLHCARCHDHKFDPIPTRDYYALAGIFHSTLTTRYDGPGVWSQVVARPLPEFANDPLLKEHDQQAAALEERREQLETTKREMQSEARASESVAKKQTRATANRVTLEQPVAANQAGGEQAKRNLAVQFVAGQPVGTSNPPIQKIEEELADVTRRLELLQYSRPEFTHVLAVQDVESPSHAPIYVRGNFRTLGELAPRGFLTALGEDTYPEIPADTSGRRELAEWLVADENPLTPRVLANRVWHHLFGTGLVRSVDYFGMHGDTPSHPELLDYLALRFRDDYQWSLKRLVREIVLSGTYRMASTPNAAAAAIDPENRLLWRMNRRRLTAESIRDGLMAISGRLDSGRGGPSLGLEIPGNVGGIGDQVNPPTYSGSKIPDEVVNRRAIYWPVFRKPPDGQLEILDVFDFPHPSEITGDRAERTVPTQALFLLNAPFVREQARFTAERLLAAVPASRGNDEARVRRLFLLVLNRPADEAEVEQATNYVRDCRQDFSAEQIRDGEAELAAWTDYCRALFASNEFLFRE